MFHVEQLSYYFSFIYGVIFTGYSGTALFLFGAWFVFPDLRNEIIRLVQISHSLLIPAGLGYILFRLSQFPSFTYEEYSFYRRTFGWWWFLQWGDIIICGFLTQLLWIKKLRQSIWIIPFAALVGIDFERIIILITSLHRDYLPSSWTYYYGYHWTLARIIQITIYVILVTLIYGYKRKGAKALLFLLIASASSTAIAGADTILQPGKRNIYNLEHILEQRKRRLDSSLKITDAIIDSITRNEKNETIDTLQMLYLLEVKKEQEESKNLIFLGKVGILTFLIALGFGFYVWMKRRRR